MSFSNISPTHRMQFFMNCSSVGPFCGVQSFSRRLLQCGSPMVSQVLPENMLLQGLLSMGHSSSHEPPPACALHRVTDSFRVHSPPPAGSSIGCSMDICSIVDLHGLQGDNLHHHRLLQGCRGISASVPGAPIPLASSLTLACLLHFLTALS